MAHLNYHEVAGANPAECGRELGRLFGPVAREYVNEERKCKAWQQRRRDAEVLLSHTARHFPVYVDELQAYADAARIALLDLWTMTWLGMWGATIVKEPKKAAGVGFLIFVQTFMFRP